MISIEQIKAARALLGWGQADLARAAKIALPTLANLERGAVAPRQHTLHALMRAFEAEGIEFIDGPGVRRQQEILKIEMLEGEEIFEHLFEDFYATLRKKGGDLLVRGITENKFMKAARAPLVNYIKKVQRHGKMRSRLLVCEGDKNFVGKRDTSLYRWVDKETFGLVPCYLYGDKYAVLLWGPPVRAVITQNAALAETYRRQFEYDWRRAQIPPKNIPYYWES